jgi:hypothetical protein
MTLRELEVLRFASERGEVTAADVRRQLRLYEYRQQAALILLRLHRLGLLARSPDKVGGLWESYHYRPTDAGKRALDTRNAA